jgi:hypothetical protein
VVEVADGPSVPCAGIPEFVKTVRPLEGACRLWAAPLIVCEHGDEDCLLGQAKPPVRREGRRKLSAYSYGDFIYSVGQRPRHSQCERVGYRQGRVSVCSRANGPLATRNNHAIA